MGASVGAAAVIAWRRRRLAGHDGEMTLTISALCFDALDPVGLGRFWSEVLGRELVEDRRLGVVLRPEDDAGFPIRFAANPEPKTGRLQAHFDLTSATPEDQEATVALALALGASHLDVGQLPDEGQVVLADPEGNEFCVLEAGNGFTAGCGSIGALSGDGSRATGCFWSAVLGWPLVWDQDEETAIQSPLGGTKMSWGGPPLLPRTGRWRPHLDLAPSADSDQQTEVARLLALGATHADIGQGEVDRVVLADPDGHELCVLASR